MNILLFAEAYVNGIPVGLGDVALLSGCQQGRALERIVAATAKVCLSHSIFPILSKSRDTMAGGTVFLRRRCCHS